VFLRLLAWSGHDYRVWEVVPVQRLSVNTLAHLWGVKHWKPCGAQPLEHPDGLHSWGGGWQRCVAALGSSKRSEQLALGLETISGEHWGHQGCKDGRQAVLWARLKSAFPP